MAYKFIPTIAMVEAVAVGKSLRNGRKVLQIMENELAMMEGHLSMMQGHLTMIEDDLEIMEDDLQ